MNNELYHYGVLGMKWGRRKKRTNGEHLTTKKIASTKKVVDSARQLNDSVRIANQSSMNRSSKKSKEKRMDLSSMTDQELRQRINRELLERQYNDVFNPHTISKGRQFATSLVENTGSVLAITSSALGVALAIKELRG